jgi:glycosyltransferase involved in cell wall biosynthesis
MTTVGDGLRIAIIGSRGIPAGYGGFETFAQELAPRLVDRGHDVTVYCRRGYTGDDSLAEYKGVRLVHTPALRSRSFEQLSHEFTSIVDSLRRRVQLYYFLGYRGAPFYIPIRGSRRVVVVNTNGLEWKRRKWNAVGRAYLRTAEWIAAHVAADELVSDARAIAEYFQEAHGVASTYLVNGAYVLDQSAMRRDVLAQYEVTQGGYYLVACRIEPENNVDLIVREFIASGSKKELVIAGGMNYETPFWQELQALARGARVRFLGPVYGEMLVESLHLGAYGYLHGHEVGGTNPALLKAMGCANLTIALDTPFNRENLADTGRYWTKDAGSLASAIRWADEDADRARALGATAQHRIRTRYTWDQIADQHDSFFRSVAARHGYKVAQRPMPQAVGA